MIYDLQRSDRNTSTNLEFSSPSKARKKCSSSSDVEYSVAKDTTKLKHLCGLPCESLCHIPCETWGNCRRPHRCEYFAPVWGSLYAFNNCRLHLKCEGTCAENNFVLRRNGRVHLSWRGLQFSRLLAAELCASAIVMALMLDSLCSEVV